MPKIAPKPAPRTAATSNAAPAKPAKPAAAATQAATPKTWGSAKPQGTWAAAGAARPKPAPAQYPPVATNAKAFVDSYALPTNTQVEMVASSQATNQAADALLNEVATELASQLGDRGQDAAGEKVMKDLNAFMKKLGPAKGYYVDPDRGSMAALEDNGDRQTKVMAQLGKLTAQLNKVNAEPAGENQQAYNRNAAGSAVAAEATFAMKFEKAYNIDGDDALVKQAQSFFKALPKKVDSQVESRGGSMEWLERSGGAATALNDYAAKLPSPE
jgi:hypothetical protein